MTTERPAATALRESNAYLEAHRDAFVRDHHREFVLIIGSTTVGFFPDREAAYLSGKQNHPDDVFLIRQCLLEREEDQAIFRSRVGV